MNMHKQLIKLIKREQQKILLLPQKIMENHLQQEVINKLMVGMSREVQLVTKQEEEEQGGLKEDWLVYGQDSSIINPGKR